jgi:Ca-activated chloride channel family protein
MALTGCNSGRRAEQAEVLTVDQQPSGASHELQGPMLTAEEFAAFYKANEHIMHNRDWVVFGTTFDGNQPTTGSDEEIFGRPHNEYIGSGRDDDPKFETRQGDDDVVIPQPFFNDAPDVSELESVGIMGTLQASDDNGEHGQAKLNSTIGSVLLLDTIENVHFDASSIEPQQSGGIFGPLEFNAGSGAQVATLQAGDSSTELETGVPTLLTLNNSTAVQMSAALYDYADATRYEYGDVGLIIAPGEAEAFGLDGPWAAGQAPTAGFKFTPSPMSAGARVTLGLPALRHRGYMPGVKADAAVIEEMLELLDADEELWIIEKAVVEPNGQVDGEPGTGSLLAKIDGEDVPVPLAHTAVDAQVSGYVATVDVTQQFHNPFDEKIEAVYVFPLPQNAAVNEFVMTVGERKIRGIIREREQARKIYNTARDHGHIASLLTQNRPNIFTQKVANLEPETDIDIHIRYFNTLAYLGGSYEFVFPMVVGPRYNPVGTGDGIGAVAHTAPESTVHETEVQYLRPEERSGHDIAITLNIDAGVALEEVSSVNHEIDAEYEGDSAVTVTLACGTVIPNKDFVLRYRVAGDTVKSSLMTHRGTDGGYFTLMLYPPEDLHDLPRQSVEMIFVLDCSGSMSGQPLAKAKSATVRALMRLQPTDTFQIIRFSEDASSLGEAPVPATDENVAKGLAYLQALQGQGGTKMIEGIKAALDYPNKDGRFRVVSFMTDGYIGNEAEILGAVHDKRGDARVFSFGVGSSVNRYLLEGMARLGRGAVAWVGLQQDTTEAVDLFYERVSHAAMTDVTIDWGTLEVTDVFPSRVPDLFAGRPVVLTGRFKGDPTGTIMVHGTTAGHEASFAVHMDSDNTASHPGLASVWARQQIRDLSDRATHNTADQSIGDQILQLALNHSLMSQFTSFVAVDSMSVTGDEQSTTVAVPVPVPDGVDYNKTVTE